MRTKDGVLKMYFLASLTNSGRTEADFRWGLLIYKKNLKKSFFPIISNFLLYETQKVGAPRDTRDPQFRPPEVCVLSITNII